MPSLGEVAGQLQAAAGKVNESIQSLMGAESDAGELQSQMAGLGFEDKAALLAAVKETIERARTQLAGAADLIEQATNQTQIAGG
jgi:hypothetical protein